MQSIERAFALLRAVAAAGPQGAKLTEIAEQAGLHVASVHRLLGALAHERAVSFDPYSRVYHIGYDFLQRAEDATDLRLNAHFGAMVKTLAEQTGDVVYLYTRHGLDVFCIDCARGSYPTRPLTLGTGGRRPLGIGAGSLVLLGSLPAREMGLTIDANHERYARYTRITVPLIREMLRGYWQDGYVFHKGYVQRGVSGLSIPLRNELGEVVAAVSVTAEEERLEPERRMEVVRLMRSEASRAGLFPAGAKPAR